MLGLDVVALLIPILNTVQTVGTVQSSDSAAGALRGIARRRVLPRGDPDAHPGATPDRRGARRRPVHPADGAATARARRGRAGRRRDVGTHRVRHGAGPARQRGARGPAHLGSSRLPPDLVVADAGPDPAGVCRGGTPWTHVA